MPEEEKTEEKQKAPREPSQEETAVMIADQLGETEEIPRAQILAIVRGLGRTQAKVLLQQTLDIEAGGGMMVLDSSRRRTLGGIYFESFLYDGQDQTGRQAAQKTNDEEARWRGTDWRSGYHRDALGGPHRRHQRSRRDDLSSTRSRDVLEPCCLRCASKPS